jgi:hypothetical protein
MRSAFIVRARRLPSGWNRKLYATIRQVRARGEGSSTRAVVSS